MTLQEIGDRLMAEFPDAYTTFKAEASSFGGSTGNVRSECTIYHERAGHISCESLEDGIRMMRTHLAGMGACQHDVPEADGKAVTE